MFTATLGLIRPWKCHTVLNYFYPCPSVWCTVCVCVSLCVSEREIVYVDLFVHACMCCAPGLCVGVYLWCWLCKRMLNAYIHKLTSKGRGKSLMIRLDGERGRETNKRVSWIQMDIAAACNLCSRWGWYHLPRCVSSSALEFAISIQGIAISSSYSV